MSSLVINAATLDDDYNNNGTNNNYGNNGNNASCRKNQTYKNKNAQKIDKTMLHQLYNSNSNDADDTLGDFVPVQKPLHNSNFQQHSLNTMNTMNTNSNSKKNEQSEEEDVVDKRTMESTYENELYKQYINNYNNSYAKDVHSLNQSNQLNSSFYTTTNTNTNTNNDLLKRLDKILYLLEEEKNDQSHLITEELILYVFLGVFIIYVLDSFVRAGKYVR